MTIATAQRMTAEIEGDFVVFLIGMRINKPWKVHKWWPVFNAMRPMIKELERDSQSGFLGHIFGWPVIVQYWRSFEDLERYARSRDKKLWPGLGRLQPEDARQRGDVGIWHETFRVAAGQYVTIYSGMPAWGLRAFGTVTPAGGRKESARERIGVSFKGGAEESDMSEELTPELARS
jgi:hypothetical protein